ncbi:lipoprotein [Williamsoniiplasma lucivorax]|uniref:Lipoprotein n=1 Tax=Williamsoniiplasma lucivorax TaxID=209274 RepID=A0A2S5REJ9_9MOLU|nr:lipoprotein [Williamsoniiplasma lucivorax]PPE05727.1 hypothetical protein ELUCI_v1c00130 [Williamsoniiplasma lucivorax]
MKKLLTLLGTIAMVASASATVVACGTDTSTQIEPEQIPDQETLLGESQNLLNQNDDALAKFENLEKTKEKAKVVIDKQHSTPAEIESAANELENAIKDFDNTNESLRETFKNMKATSTILFAKNSAIEKLRKLFNQAETTVTENKTYFEDYKVLKAQIEETNKFIEQNAGNQQAIDQKLKELDDAMNTFQTKGANELKELQELIIEANAADMTNPHAVGAITTFQNTIAKIKEFVDSKPTNPEKIKIKTKQLKQAIEQFYRDNLQGSKDKLNKSLAQANKVLFELGASNETRMKLEQLMSKVPLQQNTDDIKEINKMIANLESAINDVDISIKMLSELKNMILIAKRSVDNPHASYDSYIQLQNTIGEAEKIVKNSANNGEAVNDIHAKLKLAIDEFHLVSLQGSLFVLKASFEKAQKTLQKPGASREDYINLKQVIKEAQKFIADEPINVDEINAMITKIMRATSEFNLSGTVKIVSELKEMILVARELAKEPFMPHEIYIKLQDVIYNAQQVVDNNFDDEQMVVMALDQLESKIDEINRLMLDETLDVLTISLKKRKMLWNNKVLQMKLTLTYQQSLKK